MTSFISDLMRHPWAGNILSQLKSSFSSPQQAQRSPFRAFSDFCD